jgi:hypothetical protein
MIGRFRAPRFADLVPDACGRAAATSTSAAVSHRQAVGARKTSIMWVKAKYLKQLKASNNEAEFMYDLLLGVDNLPKAFNYKWVKLQSFPHPCTIIGSLPGKLSSWPLLSLLANILTAIDRRQRHHHLYYHNTFIIFVILIDIVLRGISISPSSASPSLYHDHSSSSLVILARLLILAGSCCNASLRYPRGKPLLIVNKNGGYNTMLRERAKWYTMAGAKAKNHPSGGFSRPLSLLASGLCTRVDIYGFSSRASGKYFQRSFKVLPTHLMKFEHWVYRFLQSKGRMCVYGE